MDDPFPPGMVAELESLMALDLPSGQDLYPEVFAANIIFPLQRQAEMRSMIRKARDVDPRTIFEIGADKGGSLFHWCKCFPNVERIIACEIRGTPYAEAFERAFPNIQFLWLPTSSYDPPVIDRVHSWLDCRKIDVLFIDGDKGAFDKDFDAYLPMMARPGIVFMHDINEADSPMRAAFEEKRKGRQSEEIIDLVDTRWAMERKASGQPIMSSHEAWLRHWHGRSCGVGVIRL